MRNIEAVLIALIVIVSLGAGEASAAQQPRTYYLSSSAGSDSSDGLAPRPGGGHGPWKTMGKAGGAVYAPGDRLLMKRGDTWTGTLSLRANGTPSNPITVGAYGAGDRPLIKGSGSGADACVVFDRCAGWRIQGLAMQGARNAIRILLESRVKTEYDTYQIEDCFFRDILTPDFPNVARREGSQHTDLRRMGWVLFVDGFESPAPVRVRNLTVRHCAALWSQGFYIHVMGHVSAENVLFDGNTLSHISYNAIYQAGARHFDITNSVLVYGYPWASHPNGATQVLAGGLEGDASARNEVSNNEFGWGGDSPGCPDGCAYDFEGATNGVAFRNNLIHDTFGEPVLFMGNFAHKDLLFDGNILRDCVRFSARWDANVTVTNSNTGSGTFSNNRFFLRPGKRAFTQKPPAFAFTNNDESAAGEFVSMPLVSRITRARGARTYTVSCSTPGAAIHYTLDGSRPMESSPRYAGPVRVARSGALNVRAFKSGLLPSYVNSLVVDLRDEEGGPPMARWSPTGKPGAATSQDLGPSLDVVFDTFTVACWVSPTGERQPTAEPNIGKRAAPGQQYALGPLTEGPSTEAGIALSVGTNGITAFESATDYQPCTLTVDRPLTGWHHVVVVYRDKQPSLYVDGIYERAGNKSTRPVHPLFALGGAANGFAGKLGELRVYDRVLTDAEIQELATARR